MQRGEVAQLKPDYWLDLEEQGYVLVRTEQAILRPDVEECG